MGARPREERFVKFPEMDGDVFSRQSGNLNDSATVMGHSQEMFCFYKKKSRRVKLHEKCGAELG